MQPDESVKALEDTHSVDGQHHHRRRRKKKRLSRRARLKLRYAFVLAIMACIAIGFILYELNDPKPQIEKFDPQKYRNDFLKKKP